MEAKDAMEILSKARSTRERYLSADLAGRSVAETTHEPVSRAVCHEIVL